MTLDEAIQEAYGRDITYRLVQGDNVGDILQYLKECGFAVCTDGSRVYIDSKKRSPIRYRRLRLV